MAVSEKNDIFDFFFARGSWFSQFPPDIKGCRRRNFYLVQNRVFVSFVFLTPGVRSGRMRVKKSFAIEIVLFQGLRISFLRIFPLAKNSQFEFPIEFPNTIFIFVKNEYLFRINIFPSVQNFSKFSDYKLTLFFWFKWVFLGYFFRFELNLIFSSQNLLLSTPIVIFVFLSFLSQLSHFEPTLSFSSQIYQFGTKFVIFS